MDITTNNQNAASSNLKPYRILSLDGGGMRGVYQATYLLTMVDRIARFRGIENGNFDIGKAFDMVVGTSTGGLIASALFAGVPLSQVLGLYYDDGPKIFPGQRLRSVPGMRFLTVPMGYGTKRGAVALGKSLEALFGVQTIGELYQRRGIALCIPAVNLANHSSVVFKTPHLPRSNKRDDTRRLVDACLATTSAPLYRAPAVLSESTSGSLKAVYTDGGLWANNPAFIGAFDAMELLREAKQSRRIEVFMLGTLPGQGGEVIKSANKYRRALAWGLGAKVITVSMNAQATGHDYTAQAATSNWTEGSFAYRLPARTPSLDLHKRLSNLDDARKFSLDLIANHAIRDVDYGWALAEKNGVSELLAFRSALESIMVPQ